VQICEEVFAWLSRYKSMVAYMNKAHFMFFLIIMTTHHNRKIEKEAPPPPQNPLKFVPVDALQVAPRIPRTLYLKAMVRGV
jgi:hypothetical protein